MYYVCITIYISLFLGISNCLLNELKSVIMPCLICTSDLYNGFSTMLTIPWFPVSDPLECTRVCHDPVVRLCKNTMKRYGSVDSGYHSHFSHIFQTSLTPRPGAEQDDDEVD